MPDSTSEQVLKALFAALGARMPAGATFVRNETLPSRIPAGGWVCLRDGNPGDPDFLFSPPAYVYEHAAEVDVVVDRAGAAVRDQIFDALKQAIGEAVSADRTLGGLCDYVIGEAPVPADVPVEGGESLKAASIAIILHYAAPDPLG